MDAGHAPQDSVPQDPAPFQSARLELLLVFVVAFAARGIHLAQASASPLFKGLVSDAHTFDEWARGIARGDWLGHEAFYQAPLYPYFLGSLYTVFGRDLVFVRIVQALLGALACVLVAHAAGRVFGRTALRCAGLMLALYPPAIFFDGLIQKSALDGVIGAALIAALVHFGWAEPRRRARTSAMIGVLLGLFALTRENTLIFVPLVAVWMFAQSKDSALARRIRQPGWMIATFVLTLSPVALRNHAFGGGFAPTTWNVGANFYIGNNPSGIGTYTPLRVGRADPAFERRDALELASAELGHPVTPSEASRFWFGKAWHFIRTDTGRWLSLMWSKTGLALNVHEIGDAEDLYFAERTCTFLRALDAVWNFGVLFPLAVVGIVATWRRWRTLWIFHALLAAVLFGLVAFFVFGRFRYPAVPYLALFAAGGIVEVVQRVSARRFTALLVPCAAGVVAAIVANLPLVARDMQAFAGQLNTAKASQQLGRNAEARAAFEAALAIAPDSLEAHTGIALLLRGAENEKSLEHLRASARIAPTDPDVLVELGKGCILVEDLDGARSAYQAALRAWPDHPGALSALGALEVLTDQPGPGLAKMRESVRIAPDDPGLAIEFAAMLLLCPEPALRDPREAARVAERAAFLATFDRPRALDTLSDAYAASGDSARAISAAERALVEARERGQTWLVDTLQQKIADLRAMPVSPSGAR